MVEELLKIIGEAYPLTKVDAGEFQKMKVSGMNFTAIPYDAEGLGRVSVMKASGMMGLMKMQSLLINPFYVDAPLVSCDFICAMGKNTLYLEPFNTQLEAEFDESGMLAVKKQYAELEDKDPGQHWYDDLHMESMIFKCGSKCQEKMTELVLDYFRAYIAAAQKAPACDDARKRRKAAEYNDGLIEHGGPATDPYIKKFGREKTGEFFRKVMFGCSNKY